MAEELRLQKRLGNSRAVDFDERQLFLRAAFMHGARHQLLAGAGFTCDQHSTASRRHQLDALDQIDDGATLADDAVPLNGSAKHHRRGRFDPTVSC
jgi:hypothetical protein